MTKKFSIGKALYSVYFALIASKIATLFSSFTESNKVTAILMPILSSLLVVVAILLYINGMIRLKTVNDNFKFAFIWVLATNILSVIGSICTAIGFINGFRALVLIGAFIDIICSFVDIVYAMAMSTGIIEELEKQGSKNLVQEGTNVEKIFLITTLCVTIIQGTTVAIDLNNITIGQRLYIIIGIVSLIGFIVAYFCFLSFIRKAAKALS